MDELCVHKGFSHGIPESGIRNRVCVEKGEVVYTYQRKVPTMTRAHFEFIAQIISEFPQIEDREKIAKQFAHWLARTNPRFDGNRFISACGVEVD